MAFDLQFSSEFFMSEYDQVADRCTENPGNVTLPKENWAPRVSVAPFTVRQAILAMSDEDLAELATEVFPLADPGHLCESAIMDKIREVNTCSNLGSPVQVWIDDEGWYTVSVYDRPEGWDSF